MYFRTFEKEYYFNFFHELPKRLKEYDDHIKDRMDENYLQLIRDLQAIQPEINQEKVAVLEADTKAKWGRGANETIQYYKTLWHLG